VSKHQIYLNVTGIILGSYKKLRLALLKLSLPKGGIMQNIIEYLFPQNCLSKRKLVALADLIITSGFHSHKLMFGLNEKSLFERRAQWSDFLKSAQMLIISPNFNYISHSYKNNVSKLR
jgi:hypothetical protein